MRVIKKNDTELKTTKIGIKSLLIFRSNSNFIGYIEYIATRKLPNGKVYKVDKATYKQVDYHAYFPKNKKPMFNFKF